MTDPTKALTLHQPYASLIAQGVKRIETRSWRTQYRGWVAIHAGLSTETIENWEGPYMGARTADHYLLLGFYPGEHGGPLVLPLGAVVAVARLTDCVPIIGPHELREAPYVRNWGDGSPCGLYVRWKDAEDDGDPFDISDQIPYGDYSEARWAWLLSDIHPLPEPIPAKGRQGLWRPDEDLTAAIRKQMPKVAS